MFWPLGPIVVTVVVNFAAPSQTSCASLSLVPLVKLGTMHSAGASVGWGVASGSRSTGSPDPAKLVITTDVAVVVSGIELPTISPITGVAGRKVALTDTR